MRLNVRYLLITILAAVTLGIASFHIKTMEHQPALLPDAADRNTPKILVPKLGSQAAKVIAQQIWDREIDAPTAAMGGLDIADTQKELIHSELFKIDGIVDRAVRNWKGTDFSSLLDYPEWLRLGFARMHYLQNKGENIGALLEIKDIGGFSIKVLLAYGIIPAAVPHDGFLHLESKRINDMTGFSDITGLNNLRHLLLHDNLFTTLPADLLTGLNNLETIYLNANHLKTLPAELFDNLNKLREIYLNDNELETLPAELFAGLINLHKLFLFNNQITTVPAELLAGLKMLHLLCLNKNKLRTLPAGIFADLNYPEYIDLSKNPLQGIEAKSYTGSALQELLLQLRAE